MCTDLNFSGSRFQSSPSPLKNVMQFIHIHSNLLFSILYSFYPIHNLVDAFFTSPYSSPLNTHLLTDLIYFPQVLPLNGVQPEIFLLFVVFEITVEIRILNLMAAIVEHTTQLQLMSITWSLYFGGSRWFLQLYCGRTSRCQRSTSGCEYGFDRRLAIALRHVCSHSVFEFSQLRHGLFDVNERGTWRTYQSIVFGRLELNCSIYYSNSPSLRYLRSWLDTNYAMQSRITHRNGYSWFMKCTHL